MTTKKTIFVSLLAIFLFTGVAVGVTSVSLERLNPMEVSQATSTNDPLLELTYQQEIPSGTQNTEFVTIYNNYDEAQDVTFDINNSPNMTFTDGTNVKTFTVNPNSTTTVYVDTDGPTKTCAETTDRQQQDFNYISNSPTYTIDTTTNIVQVCQPGGGNGNGNNGGNNGKGNNGGNNGKGNNK